MNEMGSLQLLGWKVHRCMHGLTECNLWCSPHAAIGLLAYKYGTRTVWHNSVGAIGRAGSSMVTQLSRTMTGMVSR